METVSNLNMDCLIDLQKRYRVLVANTDKNRQEELEILYEISRKANRKEKANHTEVKRGPGRPKIERQAEANQQLRMESFFKKK